MDKALDVTSVEDTKEKVSDVVIVGNPDQLQLLCKASSKSQGWMKSAKAMEIPGVGCVVQVTTQQGDNVAEALTFVPDAMIVDDINNGKKLVADPDLLCTIDCDDDDCDLCEDDDSHY